MFDVQMECKKENEQNLANKYYAFKVKLNPRQLALT